MALLINNLVSKLGGKNFCVERQPRLNMIYNDHLKTTLIRHIGSWYIETFVFHTSGKSRELNKLSRYWVRFQALSLNSVFFGICLNNSYLRTRSEECDSLKEHCNFCEDIW